MIQLALLGVITDFGFLYLISVGEFLVQTSWVGMLSKGLGLNQNGAEVLLKFNLIQSAMLSAPTSIAILPSTQIVQSSVQSLTSGKSPENVCFIIGHEDGTVSSVS